MKKSYKKQQKRLDSIQKFLNPESAHGRYTNCSSGSAGLVTSQSFEKAIHCINFRSLGVQKF